LNNKGAMESMPMGKRETVLARVGRGILIRQKKNRETISCKCSKKKGRTCELVQAKKGGKKKKKAMSRAAIIARKKETNHP